MRGQQRLRGTLSGARALTNAFICVSVMHARAMLPAAAQAAGDAADAVQAMKDIDEDGLLTQDTN